KRGAGRRCLCLSGESGSRGRGDGRGAEGMVDSHAVASSRGVGRLKILRTAALAMLCVAGVINYLDRITLSIGEERIRKDLNLSYVEMGALLSAFSLSYAFAQLPTGALVDKVGPRILLAAGMALWSVAQACGGLVTSLRQFFWARI